MPLYGVGFERKPAVSGAASSPAIQLPFDCTDDGTIFISFIGTVPAHSGIKPPLFPPLELISLSPSSTVHLFRLDQVPELYVSRELDHYASDSEVIFLVKASTENKPEKRTYPMKDGSRGEYSDNSTPQHLYLVVFSRDGEYRRTIEIDDSLRLSHVGIFSSGTFLAFGLDEQGNSPKLAMLKEDGTLLQFLKTSKGELSDSLVQGVGSAHPGTVAVVQLVPLGRSILVVQNDTAFPILEISEGGAIRAIHAALPEGEQIVAVIPSDRGLYVVSSSNLGRRQADDGAIYELNPETGAVRRRFELGGGRTASDMACVHDGKFLAVDFGDGNLVPLIGTPQPLPVSGKEN